MENVLNFKKLIDVIKITTYYIKNIFPFLVALLLMISINITKLTAQSTCAGSLGAPIFFEDFGTPSACYSTTGLSAGTTNYTFKAPSASSMDPPNDGEYVLFCGSTAPWWNWGLWHQTYYDHTTGTGTGTGSNMLIVNASFTSGEFYRRAVTGLCPNTNYTFSIYVANMADLDVEASVCGSGSIKPDLAFNIFNSGTSTILASSNTGPIPLSANFKWNYYDFSFTTSAGQTSVDVVLQNLASGGCGNDLALDDIAVKACGPSLSAALNPSASVNTGTTVTLDGTIGGGFVSPVYQWQSSTDGISWTNISGATTIDYILPNVTSADAKYYRLLSAENGNINNINCRIVSNAIQLNVITVTPLKDHSLQAYFVSENEVELIWNSAGQDACTFEVYGSVEGTDYVLLNTMTCKNTYLYDYKHTFGEHPTMKYFKIKEYKNTHYATWSNVAFARSDSYNKTQMSFFPNPISTGSEINVYCSTAVSKIDLFDLKGRWINTFNIQDESSFKLDISELPKGLYFAKAETTEEILIEKIVLE